MAMQKAKKADSNEWSAADERAYNDAHRNFDALNRRRNAVREQQRKALETVSDLIAMRLPGNRINCGDLADLFIDRAHELREVLAPYDKGPPIPGETVEREHAH